MLMKNPRIKMTKIKKEMKLMQKVNNDHILIIWNYDLLLLCN